MSTRRFGDPGSPQSAAAPSEAPSETPSYAAGRPSQQGSLGWGGSVGRKHYTPSESGFDDDDNQSTARSITGQPFRREIKREPKPRTPAPFADLSDLPAAQRPVSSGGYAPSNSSYAADSQAPPVLRDQRAQRAPAPRSPPPFAMGGNFEQGFRRDAQPQPVAAQTASQQPETFGGNFWSQRDPQRQMGGTNDVGSECGQSDVMSVADSQREVFTARDRGGHGNILTWGDNSRNITPHRKRQGRQLAMESDGLPKAHAAMGIFPPP